MPSYKIGQEILWDGETTMIVEVIKGAKTNNRNMHSGILMTGYKSKHCTYVLSNGLRVYGSTIKKHQK